MVPKFQLDGGSRGNAALVPWQSFLPLTTPHIFQKVHLDTGGAPGIVEVSASRNHVRSRGFLFCAPPSSVSIMRRKAPAVNTSASKAERGPGNQFLEPAFNAVLFQHSGIE